MDALNIRLLLDDSTPIAPDDAGGCVLIEGRGREARSDYCQVDRWLLELVDGISVMPISFLTSIILMMLR